MVRRWSFVTTTNKSIVPRYTAFKHFLFDINVNSVMYLRKSHSFYTVTRRRPWARRKHLSNWLIGSNILKFWARNYRSCRNTHKFLQNVFSMRTSFITFGAHFKQKKLLATLQASSDIKVSRTTKSLFRLTNKRVLWYMLPLLSYSYISPLFISSNLLVFSPPVLAFFNSIGFFAYTDSKLLSQSTPLGQHITIFSKLFSIWLVNLKLLYYSLILLFLSTLN